MKLAARHLREVVEGIPVLKMPPELAVAALRVLAAHAGADERRKALSALRPSIPTRTLVNAYVLPSLTELRLYEGTLRNGNPSRFGYGVAKASDSEAISLMAKHLVGLDEERVGLLGWLQGVPGGVSRRLVAKRFAEERLGSTEILGPFNDRLGKWLGYLIHFSAVREEDSPRGGLLSANSRQLAAIASRGQPLPSAATQAEALLAAYARASHRQGTHLYIPIAVLRDELGRELEQGGSILSDQQLDAVLRNAGSLLKKHVVSFSPFSGPARGGLKLDKMYAGFMSIRRAATPATTEDATKRGSRR